MFNLTINNQLLKVNEEEVLYLAQTIYEKKIKAEKQPFTNCSLVKDYLDTFLRVSERERFVVLILNTQHQLIKTEILFEGTVDEARVYPREIIKTVLKHNGSAVIFTHNHPSGSPEPSDADRKITKRLVEALALLDIRVLDHFIIADEHITSFAEKGFM